MSKRDFRIGYIAAAALLPLALAAACSSGSDADTSSTAANGPGQGGSTTTNVGGGTAAGGSAAGGAGTSSGGQGQGGGGEIEFHLAPCQGKIYECGDTIDNDGDGFIDWQDPHCFGPCDNNEAGFVGNIPGQNSAPCKMDCYFDQDTGSGNDDCYWDHGCDEHSVDPDYYPQPHNQCKFDWGTKFPGNKTCEDYYNQQSQQCLDYCGPLTPNGCDCFGCCDVRGADPDKENYVYLGSIGPDKQNPTECTLADVDDPTICHPCDPVPACLNPCEECELCIGKTELPEHCNNPGSGGSGSTSSGSGGSTQCPPNVQPCGLPGQDPCSPGFYCLTGCCIQVPE